MPWTKKQTIAIRMSYKRRGKKIPAKIEKELKYWYKHPSKAKKKVKKGK